MFDSTSKTQDVSILTQEELRRLAQKLEQESANAAVFCGYGAFENEQIQACNHVASSLIELSQELLEQWESSAYLGSSLSEIEPHYVRGISAKKIASQSLTKD